MYANIWLVRCVQPSMSPNNNEAATLCDQARSTRLLVDSHRIAPRRICCSLVWVSVPGPVPVVH
eukprot:585152-Amphidinium_carterae.1